MSGVIEIMENFRGHMPNLPASVYHECGALGSSVVKEADSSMAHFQIAVEEEREFTRSQQRALDFGTCMHSAVLEQTTSIFAVVPADAPRRPSITQLNAKKPSPETVQAIEWWANFEKQNEGKILLDSALNDRLHGGFNAFCDHKRAPGFINNSMIENSFFHFDESRNLWLKTRPDVYRKDDVHGDFIVNYKTTSRSLKDPRTISRLITEMGYDLAAAHEMEIVSAVTERPVERYYFIFQETKAPYGIRIARMMPSMIDRAVAEHERLLNRISVAFKDNEFLAYDNDIIPVEDPAWLAPVESFEEEAS